MSNLNELLYILGSECYCSWNGKDQTPPAKIRQATTWRKCSFGDVIFTLSLICMTNWVMNAYLLISSAIDIYVSKDKLQIALWNEWEKYSNTGMTFNLWWSYFFKMIKSYENFFLGFIIFVHIKSFLFEKAHSQKKIVYAFIVIFESFVLNTNWS